MTSQDWITEKPHFVDSEDCIGRPVRFWRIFAKGPDGNYTSGCGDSVEDARRSLNDRIAEKISRYNHMTPTPDLHPTSAESQFIQSFTALAKAAHANSREKGFWDAKDRMMQAADMLQGTLAKDCSRTIISQELMLIVSEVSEAMEAVRHGNPPDDKVPEFTGLEAEISDVIIRILDMAAGRNLRIAEAVVAKMRMNSRRDRMHGGKEF